MQSFRFSIAAAAVRTMTVTTTTTYACTGVTTTNLLCCSNQHRQSHRYFLPSFSPVRHYGPAVSTTASFFQRMSSSLSSSLYTPQRPILPSPYMLPRISKRTMMMMMMAVSTNSGKHGRGMQGWFRVHKKQPQMEPPEDRKKKGFLRSGNIKYDNKVNNNIKLQICHNEYDTFVIEPDASDRLFYSMAKFTVQDIQDKLNEVYDDYDEKNIIEYYDSETTTWKPLIHINDVLKYRGGKIPFKIRLPQFYDDTPLPDNYLEDIVFDRRTTNMAYYDKTTYQMSLIGTSIKAMILLMKYDGYERSDIKQYVLVHANNNNNKNNNNNNNINGNIMNGGNGEEISTRDYILQRANNDPELQSILLNHVNALSHMIEFIHYDFVWNKIQY